MMILIDPAVAKAWFRNVNDGTIEGVEYLNKNIKTVQSHPEAKCGTQRYRNIYLMSLLKMMRERMLKNKDIKRFLLLIRTNYYWS